MKKLTIALALCSISLTGFAEETGGEIVNETEVSTGSDAEPSTGGDDTSIQHDGGCGCDKGKGKGNK